MSAKKATIKRAELVKKVTKTSKTSSKIKKETEEIKKNTSVKKKVKANTPKKEEAKTTREKKETKKTKVTEAKKAKVTKKAEIKKEVEKKLRKKPIIKEKNPIKVTDVIRKTPKKSTNKKKSTLDSYINDDELKTKVDLPVIKDGKEKKKSTGLKDYDIGKQKKEHVKFKIIMLSICKVFLISLKNIKIFFSKAYNTIKHLILVLISKIKDINIKTKEKFKGLLVKEKKTKNKKVKEKNTSQLIKGSDIETLKLNLKKNKLTKKEKKNIKKQILNADDDARKLRYRDYSVACWLGIFFVNRIKVVIFDMKRFGKKFKYGTLKDKLLIIFMLCLITGFSCVIAFCIYIVANAPEISEKRLYKSNSSILLDKNGNQFARLGTENREKVYYDELPEVLIDAIISAEDSRYFQHNGIDIARFSKAVLGQLMGRSDAGGGSTLTMQVSKNAATSVEASGIQGIIRKFTDIYLSVFVFEKKYTKEQIMEFYVNIPFLGSGAYGVQQASKTYFGKSVSELNLAEAATIAGLFQAPGAYDPYIAPTSAQARRNTILNLMHRHGYITEEERDAAKAIPIKSMLIERKSSSNIYQDFIDTVITYTIKETNMDPTVVSMTIYTTMDPTKQDVVNGIINGDTYTWKNEYAQAGIAVIDVKDGSIAAVGASRDPGQRVMNYALEARRHPGSTAKPILDYGPAIEYLGWGTGTTIIDDKYTYSSKGQIKNFDNGYKGVMMAKTALAQSRNIPALYTFQQTTNEQKLAFATGLGWKPETNISGENKSKEVMDDPSKLKGNLLESDSIGGFEGVTPMESAAAYATFARGGLYIEPYCFTKIEFNDGDMDPVEIKPIPKKVMEESTAFMINMILKYAVTSGSVGAGSVSGTDLCAKTGTSTVDAAAKKKAGIKGNVIGDSWEVAYSPDYAISTWYGYKTQLDPKYHLTGTEGGAARKAITKKLTSGIMKKNSRFSKPSSVASVEIELGTDPVMLPSPATPADLRSVEYFAKDNLPSEVSPRFAQLSNPSGLKYTSTNTQVNLSWKASSIPDAINTEKIREEMSNNIYKTWVDKYVQERINYNNATFGQFGYEVYMTNAAGTVDLGFTTQTTFTANVMLDSTTTFTVKSSYQYFKSNQSSGITISVQPNHTEIEDKPVTTTQKVAWSAGYKGQTNNSCTTLAAYNSLGSKEDKFGVYVNGTFTTTGVKIASYTITDKNTGISTENASDSIMNPQGEYEVRVSIRYNGETKNKIINIKPTC